MATTWFEQGMQQGLQQGVQQGVGQGQRQLLQTMLEDVVAVGPPDGGGRERDSLSHQNSYV